jgi:hypothetical protein
VRALPTPEPIPFRHGLGNSLEMLRAALRILGVETDTTMLSALSGAAFRTYWRDADDDPHAPSVWDPDVLRVCAFDPLAVASDAFGWRLLWYRNAPGHVAFQFVMQSIARGHPILSYGFVGEPEDVLVIGCDRREDARDLLVYTRHAPEPLPFELAEGPWPGSDARGTCVGLFDRVSARLRRPVEVNVQRALRRAVWLARTPGLQAGASFRSGLAAYAAWIDALIRPGPVRGADETAARLQVAYRLSLPDDPDERVMIGIRHVLHRTLAELSQSRREAAAFVRTQSAPFETGEASGHLDREADALSEGLALWPPVVEGNVDRFSLAEAPAGLEARLRREETARCLRIAAREHALAVDAIERHVPPTEQESMQEEEEEANEGGD